MSRRSEGVSKSTQQRTRRRVTDIHTPLRRSSRLSNRSTPSYSSSLSSSLYSRPTLSRYNEEEFHENETLDESGQSVPMDFDQDVVGHDHSYSLGSASRHASGYDYRVPVGIPRDIREETPTLYGLDGNEDELNQLQHTRDYDLYDKERILTTTVVKGPSLCSQLVSKVSGFFSVAGSLFYLLFAKVVLCDVNMYRRSADCCGRHSKGVLQSLTFFMIFFGFVFVISTIPYIESPDPPPLPPPPPPTLPPVTDDQGYKQLRDALNQLRADFSTYKLAQEDVIHELKKLVSGYFEDDKDEIFFLRSELVSYINDTVTNETNGRKEMADKMSDSILKKMDRELTGALKSLETKLTDLINERIKSANIMDAVAVKAIAKEVVDEAVSQLETSVNGKLDIMNDTLNVLKKKQVDDLIKASEKWNLKFSELERKQKENAQVQKELSNGVSAELSELQKEIQKETVKLEEELKILSSNIEKLENKLNNINFTLPSDIVTKDNVTSMIRAALYNYTADQIARFDFALESAGGRVVTSSETYDPSNTKALLFGYTLPISLSRSVPTYVIQPSVMPGDCWCFQGTEGFVTIKLVTSAIVDAVTVQHLPPVLSPVGSISSAMKTFTVEGLNSLTDEEGTVLGKLEYLQDGSPIQTFDIKNEKPFSHVRFNITSNHGNKDYTCIYRVRVHGSIPSQN